MYSILVFNFLDNPTNKKLHSIEKSFIKYKNVSGHNKA